MSLLDADIHSAHPSVIIDADAMFSEDISYFGYPSFRRSSLSRLGSSRGNFAFIYLFIYCRRLAVWKDSGRIDLLYLNF